MSYSRIPTSAQEVTSMAMVVVIAALAALSRIVYGREELRWRYTIGSVMMAMFTAMLVYGAMVHQLGEIGGHASAAIGAATGLFTDDVLRRVHRAMVIKGALPDRRHEDILIDKDKDA